MPEDEIHCGWYVTLLVDVLGQGEAISHLAFLPQTEEQKTAFFQAIKNSAGKVDLVRRLITQFFESFLHTPLSIPTSELTDEQRVQCDILNDYRIGTQMFSDTVIAYSPLSTGAGRVSTKGVYAMVFAAASTLILCLSKEVALRGGIDVGVAMELHDNDLYGPALMTVDYLEKKVAQWPRIVVSKGLMQFLRQMMRTPCADLVDQMNCKVAETCLSIIAPDVDGVAIIDYLGDAFRRTFGSVDQRSIVEAGLAFARREHEQFSRSGNYKLALRYGLLRQYYEERMTRWTA